MNPAGGDGPWRRRLVGWLISYTEVLHAHPSLARTAMFTRPSGPNFLNLVETLLALLDEGGVPVGEAAWGLDLLIQRATATAAEHGTRDAQDNEDDDALSVMIQELSSTTHPHILAASSELFSGRQKPDCSVALRF